MKKRHALLVGLFILFSYFVNAQDPVESYADYQSLTLNLSLKSGMTIERARQNSRIDSITASISFFPRDDYRQKALDLELTSTPETESKITETDAIFEWKRDDIPNKLSYEISGKVRTSNNFVKVDRAVKFPLQDLDDDLLKYTKASKYIDLNDAIESQARMLVSGETDAYKAAFRVADWVKNNIKYDLTTLTAEAVQKSSWVLANKEGVCDEITNLFISMLRSLGMPARFVSGMVYSNLDHKFGPHGWAEVYFPGYGWVPFDVTFGQYGWIDPSHLKLNDALDSGLPTASYSWVTYGAEIRPHEIELEASVAETGKKIDIPVEFAIEVDQKEVGPGSYLSLVVRIENRNSYYVSVPIIVKKAPELTESNVKEVLLAPKETQSAVWIMKIPTDVEEGYSYTSAIEVKSSFGGVAEAVAKYSKDGQVLSLEHATAVAKSYADKSRKKEFASLQLRCYPDKKLYYSGDAIKISCTSKNDGPREIYYLCLKEDCKSLSINADETLTTEFTVNAKDSGRVAVVAENEEMIKNAYVDLNVIKVADILISGLKPKSVQYGDEKVQLTFSLDSNSLLKDVEIDLGFDVLKYETLEGTRVIAINTNGKTLYAGLALNAKYKDEGGKEYSKFIDLGVQVTDVPWYAKFIRWFVGLF